MIDPDIRLHIREEADRERRESDSRYAIKLVEKIVFYVIGAASIAVLAALLNLVIV